MTLTSHFSKPISILLYVWSFKATVLHNFTCQTNPYTYTVSPKLWDTHGYYGTI